MITTLEHQSVQIVDSVRSFLIQLHANPLLLPRVRLILITTAITQARPHRVVWVLRNRLVFARAPVTTSGARRLGALGGTAARAGTVAIRALGSSAGGSRVAAAAAAALSVPA
jgi:hypothetical protein